MKIDQDSLRCEPGHANMGFTRQTSFWYLGDRYLFREDSHFPHDWNKKPTQQFWVTAAFFETEADGLRKLAEIGLDASRWYMQHSFYGPGFFPIALDMDQAIAFWEYAIEHEGDFMGESDFEKAHPELVEAE